MKPKETKLDYPDYEGEPTFYKLKQKMFNISLKKGIKELEKELENEISKIRKEQMDF